MNRGFIDVGTNTLLLLIVDEALRPVVDLCRFGRLGKGLDGSGRLAATSVAASLEICREYRAVMDAHGVDVPTVVGTQALREATNAREFVEPAQHVLRAPIEVIEGTREAQLAFLSVARSFPALAGQRYLVVDVGGGSTEIITTDGHAIESAVSVPIGAVRLAERGGSARAEIEAEVARALAPLTLPTNVPIVATAGTATTLAAVAQALAHYDSERVTGYRMTPAEVRAQYERILPLSVEARRALAGMEPGRADVVHAGIAILVGLCERTQAPVLITADRGVRWGLAYECSAGAR